MQAVVVSPIGSYQSPELKGMKKILLRKLGLKTIEAVMICR